MAYTTIDDPSENFQTALYTGDGNSTKAITNNGNSDLQPDWVWTKVRSTTNSHHLADTSRGITKQLTANNTNAEQTDASIHASVQSDGFTVGDAGSVNANNATYVSWQWKANGGTATATGSESGNNPAYSVQANTTAGFSIITYTGTGAAGTVPHGLGAVPSMIIVKNRTSGSTPWTVYHKNSNATPQNYIIVLDTTAAASDNDRFNDTAPTSSVFSVNDSGSVNENNSNHVAYCFAEKQGYSKFGIYTGNGSQDGTFVYTGFKPAWIMIKRTDAAKNWYIADSTRSPNNITKAFLVPNTTAAEDTSGDGTDAYFDILSNGFKLRQDFSHLNADGGTHIYMAFAEHPFVSSEGVPTTAR